MSENHSGDEKNPDGVRAWVRDGADLALVLGAEDRSGGWLAGKVGCSRQMIHVLTHGQRLSCSPGLAERIESVLEVPHSLLFRYDGDRETTGQDQRGKVVDHWDDRASRVQFIEAIANGNTPYEVHFLTTVGAALDLGSSTSSVLVVARGTEISDAVRRVCAAVVEEGPSLMIRLDQAVRQTQRER